jgi:RNA polymerase sigma factor (sigma-70 family)
LSTENLIKSCIEQNRVAQEELYHLYQKTLFVLSLKYCANETEAEDNLHDTFIEIFTNIKKYNGKGTFEGWMKRIAINKAINRYKQTFKWIPIEDKHNQETTVEENDIDFNLDTILRFIQELPHQYRLVFSLYELDNYSHNEIANMLSISASTSKSNLHRAKLILKDKIKLQQGNAKYLLPYGK